MRIFSSSSKNRIDGKGRVSIPAGFRRALEHEVERDVVILIPQLRNTQSIEGMGMAHFEQLADAINRMPFDDTRAELEALVLGGARDCQLDENGRIVLPPELRADLELTDEALFVGLGRSFQIWRPDVYAARAAQMAQNARANLRLLPWGGAETAGGPSPVARP